MKKFIIFIVAMIIAISCTNRYSENNIGEQIKNSVSLDISTDLLIPSSLRIDKISYVPIDTLYLADKDYFDYTIKLKVNNEMLANAKTNKDKKIYTIGKMV